MHKKDLFIPSSSSFYWEARLFALANNTMHKFLLHGNDTRVATFEHAQQVQQTTARDEPENEQKTAGGTDLTPET